MFLRAPVFIRIDQEHALDILLGLCSQRIEYCHLVMECVIFPALFDVSVNGSEKGKASALELLRLLRDTNCDDDKQECSHSDNVTSEDANYSEDKKSHKTLFGVKLFSRHSAPKKKKWISDYLLVIQIRVNKYSGW